MSGCLRIIVLGLLLAARSLGRLQVTAANSADDQGLLAEIASVQEQARLLLSGTTPDKSILQNNVMGQAKLSNGSPVGSRGFALLSASARAGHRRAARELQRVQRRVSFLMRKHPRELHRVQAVLTAAWRMERHSGAAVALHQRLRGRFANLLQMQHSQNQEPSPLASLLRNYAVGMNRVANLDRRILEATTQAKQDVATVLKSEGPGVIAEVDKMLDAAKHREVQALAAEVREANHAHEESRRLQQARQVTDMKSREDLQDNVVGKGTKSIEQLRQEQKDIKGLQQQVGHLHEKILNWQTPDAPEEPQSAKEQEQVADDLAQHLRLAKHEHRLVRQGEALDASLSKIRTEVAGSLQVDGDATDKDVSGELLKQLTEAQKLIEDMNFFHKQVAVDVAHKLRVLSGKRHQSMQAHRLAKEGYDQ